MTRAGFPHSEIRASKPACGFTRLIAACHVLLRLSGAKASTIRPYYLDGIWIRTMQFSKIRRRALAGAQRVVAPGPEKALKTE